MQTVPLVIFIAAGAFATSTALAQPAPAPRNPGQVEPEHAPGTAPPKAAAGSAADTVAPSGTAAPAGAVPAPDAAAPAGPAEEASSAEKAAGQSGAGAGSLGVTGGAAGGVAWPDPHADSNALRRQGDDRPKEDKVDEAAVYAEDWWSHARPIVELHGYLRLRAELFQNFSLGRVDDPARAQLWPMPFDNRYVGLDKNPFGPAQALCTPDEAGNLNSSEDDPRTAVFPCKNKTQAGANMRFRLNPEIHISDNLRIVSQVDMLDNLVLGSTPSGYNNVPAQDGGYTRANRSAYAPVALFDETQQPPSAGINSLKDSIVVKRAWAEYMTPLGSLRFGRMPAHFGLGIFQNAGDGYDADYQTTLDRLMFVTGIKSADLFVAGAWDFAASGATSETLLAPEAQAYDLGQLDDVDEYSLAIFRRKSEELTGRALANGDVVLNGGAQLLLRKQLLSNDAEATAAGCDQGAAIGCSVTDTSASLARRGATLWIPDLWLQLRYKKFRFEAEAVTVQGSIESTSNKTSNYASGPDGWKVAQWGFAAQIQQKLAEDKLNLEFGVGWASGDADVDGLTPTSASGIDLQQKGDNTFSTFRFHPNYQVDLILHRNLLSRVQGTYYLRPSIAYDFIRQPTGQRVGGSFAGIWTRASQFIQSPGHERDLGIELDFSLYYQAKDGTLNDGNDKLGGFFTMLQYGTLFPLGGLGFQSQQENLLEESAKGASETSGAHIFRWYLGVMF